jgi:ATP-GRASP peptide maturase of grasp-with-spasm system
MILIVSEEFDPATDHVIRWLKKSKQDVVRLNSMSELFKGNIHIDSSNDFTASAIFQAKFKDLKSIWFRRKPDYSSLRKPIRHASPSASILVEEMNRSLVYEEQIIYNFLEELASKSKVIGNISGASLSKLTQLRKASRIGLRIPHTAIITSKNDLREFKNCHEKIILKPISNASFVRFPKATYSTYTRVVDEAFINQMPEYFPVTQFQEYVDKEFEVRSFFIDEREYSMAIFSQRNDKTKVDFRKYDKEHPNRRVPFRLPEKIRNQLIQFMREININTGSFDLIFSKKGEYVFLEVNPVGQFGMVSIPCNYYLEKKIAETLMN